MGQGGQQRSADKGEVRVNWRCKVWVGWLRNLMELKLLNILQTIPIHDTMSP